MTDAIRRVPIKAIVIAACPDMLPPPPPNDDRLFLQTWCSMKIDRQILGKKLWRETTTAEYQERYKRMKKLAKKWEKRYSKQMREEE